MGRRPATVLAAALALALLLWGAWGGGGAPDGPSVGQPGRGDPTTAPDDAELVTVDGAAERSVSTTPPRPEDVDEPAPTDEPATDLSPELGSDHIHRCRVVRGDAGVPGCEVLLLERGEERMRRVTDAEGRFELPDLMHMGAMRLEIRTGQSVLTATALPRTRPRLDDERVFRLGNCVVEGRVWGYDGQPDAGARVGLLAAAGGHDGRWRQALTTDAAGRVRFVDVPAGRVTIDAISAPPNRAELTLARDGDRGEFTLGPAPGTHTLRVRVLCPDGSPSWAKLDLNCRSLDGDQDARAPLVRETWPEGDFVADLPEGRYTLEVSPETPGAPEEVLHAAPWDGVELTLPGAVVRGVLSGHQPTFDGQVAEFADSGMDAVLLDAVTDDPVAEARVTDSGRFEISGVPPGDYVLSGGRGGSQPELSRVPVTVTSTAEVIVVERLERIPR